MAIFRPGANISEIRGSIGDVTYSRGRGGPYAKAKLVQTNPDTAFQQAVRGYVTEGNAAWKLIDDETFKEWNEYVEDHPHAGRLPDRCKHSAVNEFIRRYVFRGMIAGTEDDFPAYPPVRKNPWIVELSSGPAQLTVVYDSLEDTPDIGIAVYATAPLSPGIRSINPSLYNFITFLPEAPQSGSIEFLSEYLTRYSIGSITNGDRIGICIRAINTDNFAASNKAYGNVLAGSTPPTIGLTWTIRTTVGTKTWSGIAFGNSVWVAVAANFSGNVVMTSPDGITWTERTTTLKGWSGIAFGAGLFVAVSATGSTTTSVMTSPDGITWTARTIPAANGWQAVCFDSTQFVAVSSASTTAAAMTSPDGITWTVQTCPDTTPYQSVTFGAGLLCAIGPTGSTSAVMTSPDGVTWTKRTVPTISTWRRIAFGNGLFVAVASAGTTPWIITSPDGINWTSQTDPAGLQNYGVAYGGGVYIITTSSGTGQRVLRSIDGITWTQISTPANNNWRNVAYNGDLFVAVSQTGTNNQVMTSTS